MITAGVDVGSVATKAVILDDKKILGKAAVRSRADQRATAEAVLAQALVEAGIGRADVKSIATTGYGRRATGFGNKVITEISAATRGAFFIGAPWGKPRLIADLGGQDTKVVLLESDGTMADFRMNDKCAAGTGRFLEVMAEVLGVRLDEMGDFSLRSNNPVAINATCTVFAESEVISLVSRGTAKEDIIAGLHAAVASRLAAMIRQMGDHDLFFSGGGARNKGICEILRTSLDRELYVPPDPEFVVALGAALLAV